MFRQLLQFKDQAVQDLSGQEDQKKAGARIASGKNKINE